MSQSIFPEWLQSLGAQRIDMPRVDRGLPVTHTVTYPGDVTGAGMGAAIKASPNSPTELTTFTIGTPTYNSDDDRTEWVISLSAAQTLDLVQSGDGTQVDYFVYDVLIQLGPTDIRRLFGGLLPVSGFVTEV